MTGKVGNWWLPDTVHFVKPIPHTATGKISKVRLRGMFAPRKKGEPSLARPFIVTFAIG